jgi:transcriptional regulator with XRE-family HTH domain
MNIYLIFKKNIIIGEDIFMTHKMHKRIKEERELLGKTQLEISNLIGMAVSSYALYEQGRRNPDYDTLIKLADIYNCTTDYLLGRTDNKTQVIKSPDEYNAVILKARDSNIPSNILDNYIDFLRKAHDKKD